MICLHNLYTFTEIKELQADLQWMARRDSGMGAQDYIDLQNRRTRGRNGARNIIATLSLTAAFFYADTKTDFFRDTVQRMTGSPTISVPYIHRVEQFITNILK